MKFMRMPRPAPADEKREAALPGGGKHEDTDHLGLVRTDAQRRRRLHP